MTFARAIALLEEEARMSVCPWRDTDLERARELRAAAAVLKEASDARVS